MSAPSSSGGGLFASLRRLSDTVLETAQIRIALFGSELEREKLRLVDAALLAAIGLLLLAISLVLMVALVVLLFQEGYRIPALAVIAVVFVAGGMTLLLRARALFGADEGQPFALTLRELRRDREALGARLGRGKDSDDEEPPTDRSGARADPPAQTGYASPRR